MPVFDAPNLSYDQPGVFYDQAEAEQKGNSMPLIRLQLDRRTNENIVQFAQQIHDQMTGNASFPTPDPALPAFQALITTAITANNDADMEFDHWQMKLQERNDAINTLKEALRALAAYVQNASKGDTAKILSSGMEVRGTPAPVGPLPAPGNLIALMGAQEGTCALNWDPIYGARSYIIEIATDAAGPWTQTSLTTASDAVVNSLTSGTKYFFRVRALGAAGPSPWSDIAMKMAA